MRLSHYALFFASLLVLPLQLGGCAAEKPTRLYVLNALPEAPGTASPQGLAVGIGPITLPKYIDRPEIVARINGNSLVQAEFDQWGGGLDDDITRVLAANLSSLLESDRVSLYPWKDEAPIEYQVTVDVIRFEQDADGSAVLSAFWSIVDPSDGSVLLMRRSSYREAGDRPVSESGRAGGAYPYDAAVAAMSRDLELLSRDIAATIAKLRAT
jgi:uncharacterized lipoprotein YmbA